MVKQLSDTEIDLLFRTPEVIVSVNDLIDIFENNRFVITHKAGQQYPAGDVLLLAKLKGAISKERYRGVLEILYNVRCNLFHGSKGYDVDQVELLKPVNKILYYITKALYDSFIQMIDDLENDIKIKIESFKET